ncbi:hypothetical protein COLINT_03525 [Collinsella intestinalis DSM 13280]|uniref:Uncharacterized protein n=1 Tax=Collinsella intestinalis DSM 13280 TaxID=521003 RepID=C4FBR2_9ACTN|nr:hypothetical protein COLINT_03525 [Collinsella intestinalis DSM 13280]
MDELFRIKIGARRVGRLRSALKAQVANGRPASLLAKGQTEYEKAQLGRGRGMHLERLRPLDRVSRAR